MLMHKRQGAPEEGELVMCTVTSVQYHSVFARIEEYNVTGMIHISEIAAGRIRNINDYVKVGKVIVCKVLKVHPDTGHIDLSLRRVGDTQRRQKVDLVKREQRAEDIVDHVAKELKKDSKALYGEITEKISKTYDSLATAFEDVVEEKFKISDLGLDSKTASLLEEVIRVRIKPKEVIVKGDLMLQSFEPDGLSVVKDTLMKVTKMEGTDIRYLGGGKYKLTIIAKDYKVAEPRLKDAITLIMDEMKKSGGKAVFTREGKKEGKNPAA